jgi:hypothetical protein
VESQEGVATRRYVPAKYMIVRFGKVVRDYEKAEPFPFFFLLCHELASS